MRMYQQPNEAQIEKIRSNWTRLSRLGLARFVLATGTLVFVFMTLCWVGFTFLFGTQKVLRMPFVWEATIPCMAFLSYLLPVLYYTVQRVWIRRIGPQSLPVTNLSAAPETAP